MEADSYSSVERRFLGPFRRGMMVVVSPLVRLLVYLKVPPNAVSSLQLVGGVIIILTVRPFPRATFIIFIFTLLLDALDGALARASGRSTPFGALYDQFCDHARETMVIAALAHAGALSVIPAVLYGFVYVAFNLTLFLCNHFRAPIPLAIKSYLIVYPAMFLYLWLGYDWLDPAVILSLLLMGGVIAQGLWNLKGAMGAEGSSS